VERRIEWAINRAKGAAWYFNTIVRNAVHPLNVMMRHVPGVATN
jgi:hypothetical protein